MKEKANFCGKVLFIIVVIGGPQYYLIQEKLSWQYMLLGLIVSVVILFFINLNHFTEMTIKKDGVSLKLREAQEIVNQAYASMDLIKDSMEPVIEFQYDMISKGYYPMYVKYEDVQETINKLESVAKNLNMYDSTRSIFSNRKYIVARQAAYNIIFFFESQSGLHDSTTILLFHESLRKGLSDFVSQVNKELLKLDSKNDIEAWFIFETKKVLEFITKQIISIQQDRNS